MKLAEALSLRKDLQARIEQLKVRLLNNIKVQEGEQPTEDPKELMAELNGCFDQLETLIFRINATNMQTAEDGKTITQLNAERDVLKMRVDFLRNLSNNASQLNNRYSRTEIKTVATIEVKPLRKQIDKLSEALRKLDLKIQTLNFTTELIEG
ncbi:MAG: DIP1984 family protein [Prevotella sp.]|nr:DIP1984 family protein [Prevotella sp.]